MIQHIVLFKFAQHIAKAQIIAILDELGELKNTTIPQIHEYSYGENNSPEKLDKGYNYGFVMQFLSAMDREIYLHHPDHVSLAKRLMEMMEDGVNSALVFDY